jgi:hypothetical protein
VLQVDIPCSPRQWGTTAVCAKETAGIDVLLPHDIASEDASIGGKAVTRKAEPDTTHKWASASSSACASAIRENSGVGEKPASAGPRTSWASIGRPVNW